jgi:NHL repeat
MLVLVALALPAAASGATRLWMSGPLGSEAGETEAPRGVAAMQALPGHIFVADQQNRRIDEFDPWGVFVKAWGWGVRDGAAELQTCTTATGCMKGLLGEGAGQLAFPQGVALDSEDNVYVADWGNARIQKFDSDGNFLLMFGGSVNKGPLHPGDICTATHIAEGDECGAGTVGPGEGEFEDWISVGSFIAVDSADRVYVGDKERIEIFASDGTFLEQITPSALSGKGFVQSLALDSSDAMYLAFAKSPFNTLPDVVKLDASGSSVCVIEVDEPRAISTSPSGSVYVFEQEDEVFPLGRVEEFSSNCVNQKAPTGEGELTESTGLATSAACLTSGHDLYVTNADLGHIERPPSNFVAAYGPAPDNPACPPPKVAPTISDQFTTSVTSEAAVARAVINPHFWSDTTYYVEYGTGKCSDGGCTQSANKPGAPLGSGVVDEDVTTADVTLGGLLPSTEYHYRFVAQSGGGGPVYSVEGTFVTPPAPEAGPDTCPNAQVRSGASSRLEDCRGYEMVSPVDKEGGEVLALKNITSFPARFDQAAASGGKFTYSTYRAYGDAQAAPYMSQYMATRGPNGWGNHSISAVREGPMFVSTGLESEYKAFSPDLSGAWLVHYTEPVLAPGGIPEVVNLYHRDNNTETYTAFSTSPVEGTTPKQYQIELQGFSADETHAIFRANDNNPPFTKEPGTYQLYESVNGVVQPVCILPNETQSKQPCSAGTSNSAITDRSASVRNAISDDGSRIFWTNAQGPGKIYVRIDGVETVAVSDAVNPANPPAQAQYWTAAADGSAVLFTVGEKLYVFNVDSRTVKLLAEGVAGVAGTSEDLSRIYFVSSKALGGDPDAESGKPNLYLYEAGEPATYTYVATLSSVDGVAGGTLSAIAREPYLHVARVTPDGTHLAFMSRKSLTGVDNRDANNGEQDAQVYLFDAVEDELLCVSCNRTGARPTGRDLGIEERLLNPYWAAGQIPVEESQLRASQLLSTDGTRLFFQSYDALVEGDTNGKRDVYEWEALGAGTCQASRSTYSAAADGCVSLISNGNSPQDSEVIDASNNGSDVFFATASSLVPQDPGLIDIYDAREGGGFFPPALPPAECEGEACQGAQPPPPATTPGSSTFTGPGNPPVGRKCPKGKKRVKVKGKVRCVRKHRAKRGSSKKKASKTGRAGR